MRQNHPTLGILMMIGFCIFAPICGGLAKLLTDHVTVLDLVAIRFIVQAALLLPWVWWIGSLHDITPKLYGWIILRSLCHIAGIYMMFQALTRMPLADAIAIAYVMPFLMLLLGWFFLGEEVGPRRLAACAVGFAGTLLVVQPSFVAFGLIALLPLAVAVVFSFFVLITRHIAHRTDAFTMQAVTGLVAIVILAPVLLWQERTQVLVFGQMSAVQWAVFIGVGVAGTVSHLFMTGSLRFAPLATVAPVQYLELPFAALFGWLFFQQFPNSLALSGILVVIGAGLYILFREQATMAQTSKGG